MCEEMGSLGRRRIFNDEGEDRTTRATGTSEGDMKMANGKIQQVASRTLGKEGRAREVLLERLSHNTEDRENRVRAVARHSSQGTRYRCTQSRRERNG